MHDRAQQQRRTGTRTTTSAAASRTIRRTRRVGAVDDPAEREADAVADRIIARISSQAGGASAGSTTGSGSTGAVQREAAAGSGPEGGAVDDDVDRRISRMAGGGSALPDGVRGSMEAAFGADFSGVRLHTGGESAALNQQLQANAFTTGSDIFLGAGADVSSPAGERLLAHELTHVLQQQAGVSRSSVIRRDDGDEWTTVTSKKKKGGNAGGGQRNAGGAQQPAAQPAAAAAPPAAAAPAGDDVYPTYSGHWNSSRDAEHATGKAKLLAAIDRDPSIRTKLYKKHGKGKIQKLISSFKTTSGGQDTGGYLVVVTKYYNEGELVFDTAYTARAAATTGDSGTYYKPEFAKIPVD